MSGPSASLGMTTWRVLSVRIRSFAYVQDDNVPMPVHVHRSELGTVLLCGKHSV